MAYEIAEIVQSGDGNAKIKHHGDEYRAYTISLASSDSAGRNTCPRAMRRSLIQRYLDTGKSWEWIRDYAKARGLSLCSYSCVTWEGGHGRTDHVRDARINLTNWFYENRRSFKAYLLRRLAGIERCRQDYRIACRPNVDSDIRWEDYIPEMFDYAWDWYDYTKMSDRLGNVPKGYHLTYSYNDGTTAQDWERVYATGSNIAVVFDSLWNPWGRKWGYLPAVWTDPNGKVWPVVDGDNLDFRFLDPQGVCVGLRLKATLEAQDKARLNEFSVPVEIPGFDVIHPADASAGHYLAA